MARVNEKSHSRLLFFIGSCSLWLQLVDGLTYFASKVQLGPEGVAKIHGLGDMSPFEQSGLKKLIPELQKSEAKGVAFANI